MASDTKIICFRHCCSKSIFCKNVPKICPICRSSIVNYNIEPFLVPYPYSNAKDEPTSIIVRPSEGTFLNDYHIGDDLHIGITHSGGIVVEYDKKGLIISDGAQWTNCIAINIIPSSWKNHWTETLKLILKDTKWRSENYHEITMNCFNFVIEFINNLRYIDNKYIYFDNKETMCDKLILPKLQDAVKYNSLFKQLKSTEYVIS
ncbi:MKRN2 opposite strand protein [Anthophora plagiata]